MENGSPLMSADHAVSAPLLMVAGVAVLAAVIFFVENPLILTIASGAATAMAVWWTLTSLMGNGL